MQTKRKKIGDFLVQHWQLTSIFLCTMLSIINLWWYSNPQFDSQLDKFHPHEKFRILYNKKIWDETPTHKQKIFLENQHRFQKYSFETKEFIWLLYHNWICLPAHHKQYRKKAYTIFSTLPAEQRILIRQNAIFMSCMAWENTFFASFNLLKDWNHFYIEVPNLDPLELRKYIYSHFLLFHQLSFFPFHIQKNWEKLSPQERVKIIQKMQKKMDKQSLNHWLPLLRKSNKIQEN